VIQSFYVDLFLFLFDRYMARTRWAKAIKAVRFTVKMQLALPDKTRPDFHSQEIPVLI
jgi:hypothetical protein